MKDEWTSVGVETIQPWPLTQAFLGELVFQGRDEKRTPLKTLAWEAS